MHCKKPVLTMALGLILLAMLVSCGSTNLDGTTWVLVSLNGQPPVAGSNIRLHFGVGQQQRQFEGFSGCNSYGGTYTSDQNTLKFVEIQSTAMACERQDLMQQEQVYVQALQKAATYQIENGRLEIGDAGGQTVLVFQS